MENEYIIGADKSLKEVIKGIDFVSLFRSALNAGASEVVLEDSKGKILHRHGASSHEGVFSIKKPLNLEGETAGHLIISGDKSRREFIESIGELIFDAANAVIKSNHKSVLAAETHETVASQSYNELLESNRKLQLSENKYRSLASRLEKEVQARTEELTQAHAKLLHQEKIASVGQLAAGIAHEINNPLGFISSNINTLNQYVSRFKDMLLFYRSALEKGAAADSERELSRKKWREYKFDFIFSDVEELIRESREGAERVKKIVSDLKGFSHIDDVNEAVIDINREIDRTLNVLTHEIPGDAEIIKDYESLPGFTCNPAHICQAFLNIILNSLQTGKQGLKLVITTRYTDDSIRIDFSDNGPGIPEDIKNRIFEPFFTTKEVGKGTGMGLNVTHEIIASYGGAIEVKDGPGKGATFSILLPPAKKEKDA